MQKDDGTSKPIFILPKPVYKHEHNIRFLTPHSSGKRQIFSYSEKASASSLGVKVENFKRDLLKLQMKSRLDGTASDSVKDEEQTKSTDRTSRSNFNQSQRYNNPPLYSVAVESVIGRSQQPPSYALARPLSQQRMDPKKISPTPTSYMGRPDKIAKEFRHERNPSRELFESSRDSLYAQEGTMLSKFIPGSKLNNVKLSGNISFFNDTRPEKSSISLKMHGRGKDGMMEAPRPKKDISPLTGTDRARFEDSTNLPGNTSETGIFIPYSSSTGIVRSSLFSVPGKSQFRMQSESEKKTEIQHEQYTKAQKQIRERILKGFNRHSSDIDARKRQFQQDPLHSKCSETQAANGTTVAQSGRSLFHMQSSPSGQHGASESEPRSKLSRQDSSGPRSDERIRIVRYDDTGSYYQKGKSVDDLEIDNTIPSYPDSSRAAIPSDVEEFVRVTQTSAAGRPTAIIRADRRDERDVDVPKNCGSFYESIPINNSDPRGISCECRDCQIAYRASRADSLFSGGAEKPANSYSSHRPVYDPFGHKNVDVLIKNRYDFRQPAFNTPRIENVEGFSGSPGFKRQFSTDTFRRGDRAIYSGPRKEIYYYPKHEKSVGVRTSLNGVYPETDSKRPNDRTIPGKGDQHMPYAGRNFIQGGYWDSLHANRNYPESYYGHHSSQEERYMRKSTGLLQRNSLNTLVEHGSTISEKTPNPPRLIGSNSKALETYRDRGCEKGYSEMNHRYETTSPRSKQTEESYGGDIDRQGVRRKSHVVVMYGYPRKQRLIEKGEGGPFIESVSYRIHEQVFSTNDSVINSSKMVTYRPSSKGAYVEANDGLYRQSKAEAEAKPIASHSTPVEATPASKLPHPVAKDKSTAPVEVLNVTSPSTASIETEREVDETDSAFSVTDSDDDVTSLDGATRKTPSKSDRWKRTAKSGGPRLYRFLLELLDQPEKYPCIKWLNKEERMFKFYDSEYVARLWGRRKNRPNMKYENFARSLRCYKERGILRKPRQKLVYQFANGW